MKKFVASNFQGNCTVDEDFIPVLTKINEIAIKHNMIVIITSSFRKDTNVKGAIVPPAKMSNHLIGQAIDFNLKHKITGVYYNSIKLADDTGPDELFLTEVVKSIPNIRWGDSFKVKDSVHIDTALNVRNPVKWQEKYNEIHGL
jgi:hypothetical protein